MGKKLFFATFMLGCILFVFGFFLNHKQDVQRWWLQRHLNILTEERSALLFKTIDTKDGAALQKIHGQLQRLREQSERVEIRLKVLQIEKQLLELRNQIGSERAIWERIDMNDGKYDSLDQSTLVILSENIQSIRNTRDSLIVQRDSLSQIIKKDSTKLRNGRWQWTREKNLFIF